MNVLFLSTWFPYPPNQGSKTRAFHMLRSVAREHQIALISFEDTSIDPSWLDRLGDLCSVIETVPRQPFEQSAWGWHFGWLSHRPRATVGSYSKKMGETVGRLYARWKPDLVIALTFVMAPYAIQLPVRTKIVDVDNLLSIMLAEETRFANSGLERLRRKLAAWKMRRYERQIYRPFDLCLMASEHDAQRAESILGMSADRVGVFRNGADLSVLSPNGWRRTPDTLVFNGSLKYKPNLDAMSYFVAEILPRIQADRPGVTLTITGSTRGVPLGGLSSAPGVHFSGYVEDIRPLVGGSTLCVVPLRQGAGTRLKILEAMALGTPVVSTSKGAEGLRAKAGIHLEIANTPSTFADATLKLLSDPRRRSAMAEHGLALVRQLYDWEMIERDFCRTVNSLVEAR